MKDIKSNLRKTSLILLFIVIFSCKEKGNCYPEFKKSLTYLKEYVDPNDSKSRLTNEITRNIEILESTSGILNADQGNLLCKCFVLQSDIDKWEEWINKKCKVKNNTK